MPNIQAKSIADNIRQRNVLSAATPVGVRGVIGKDATVQESGSDRFLTVMATTDDVDSSGEVVIPQGADTSYFFANRKVFVDHCLATDYCVGALHSASLKGNGWLVRMRIFDLPGNPLCNDILTIAREAGIGVSIGFVPTDMGRPTTEEVKKYGAECEQVYRAWRWMELSVTAAPCNVSAQTVNLARNEGKIALLDELVTKGRIQHRSAVALGLPSKKVSHASLVVPRKRIVVVG